ncbi:hypothetical protein ASPZODRAFT_13390 [Penicilliopsis zonata CBS 506.65]|uniref:Isochorismatase-like domain-containing protein n=1 Tax=Penicilliopsis zonata CBS 506.65 TaxID=1073090 RepID=A0A1L9ST65_9EURO|nr:hypothetical protein ASPZODRAFT_13390 [Penicilliopsis zonata CBS 506.65]OJJ50304.1 hypothetical protein ASPZODRAFT_13390 [Penicilliopsis zonata CBS 506.65]
MHPLITRNYIFQDNWIRILHIRGLMLQKTRYYAGTPNGLEEILQTQGIDTVVIVSGPIQRLVFARTSGVVITTAQRLFDLNYQVYVIANNTIEPGDGATVDNNVINDGILQGVFPKMPLNVITIEQAIDALSGSSATVY